MSYHGRVVSMGWLPDTAHLDLRYRVLREGMPRETARYIDVDDDPNTKFVGAFIDEVCGLRDIAI